jgi:dihydrofolate reductase
MKQSKFPIAMIAAMALNRVIGIDNDMPWDIPEDMRNFVKLTKFKPVIMGRKTYESLRGPLPKRRNIILTRDEGYEPKNRKEKSDVVICHTMQDALEKAENFLTETQNHPDFAGRSNNEIIIMGGANIYQQFLSAANHIYLTVIGHEFKGDALFPVLSNNWRLKEEHPLVDRETYGFEVIFKQYDNKTNK